MSRRKNLDKPIVISPDNYESHIAYLPAYAKLVVPAMLYWLDLIETGILGETKISPDYVIHNFSSNKLERSGKFDVVMTHDEGGQTEERGFTVIFDFSRDKNFNPTQVRQKVLAAQETKRKKDADSTYLDYTGDATV